MENLGSQNFGGEQISGQEVGDFSAGTGERQGFISGNATDMEREMGVKALEGLEELTEVRRNNESSEMKIAQNNEAVATEISERTDKGIDKLVEEAEKSNKETVGRPGDKEGEYQRFRESVLQSLGHYSMGGSD